MSASLEDAPTNGAVSSAPSSLVDAGTAPAWLRYTSECARSGVQDLVGLDLDQVSPYLSLNQYQRDQLSRTISTAPFRLYRSAVELVEKNLCVGCWLLRSCCMCSQLREFRCRHKVFMLMHHKEWARGSNTGKLAVRAAMATLAADSATAEAAAAAAAADPAAAIIAASAFIQTDIPLQMRALLDLCEREPLNTVVLFPSEESITIEELAAQRGWRLPAANDNEAATQSTSAAGAPTDAATAAGVSLSDCPPLNIILLDGTWRQARSMKYMLPAHIPALRIDPFKYRLDGTLRPASEQTQEERDALAREQAQVDKEERVAAGSAARVLTPNAATDSEAAISDGVAALAVSPVSPSSSAALSPPPVSRKKLSPRDPEHMNGKVAPPPSAGGSSPTFVSLFYPLRKQSQPDRISTIEALVILLMDLREPPTVTLRLLDLLRVLVDSMRVQSGMNSVYGTFTREEARAMRIAVAQGKSLSAVAAAPGAATAVLVGPRGNIVQVAVESHDDAAAAAAAGVETLRVTRKQRAQRTTAMRPCMQWNRGQSRCSADPCRFAHMCMLCNGPHPALACTINERTDAIAQMIARDTPHGCVQPIRGDREENASTADNTTDDTNEK